MGAGHGTEPEDQHGQPEDSGCGILQQLQTHVLRGQLLRSDARPDDHGNQKGGAEELGKKAARERFSHDGILTVRDSLSQT